MISAPASVQDCLDQAHDWLSSQAWPVWLEHGIDWKRQAFHESLDPTTLTCSADFRRLRVAARQTYVFSLAATQGVPRAESAVALGISFLRDKARLPGGGYAWRFDLDNKPIDLTLDLYDHAFVLLAFSSAARVLDKESMHREAVSLLGFLDAHFRHADGGYLESVPPKLPRRQNPHMHLLEALLAAFTAFKDERFLDRSSELIDLFLTRMFQSKMGALPEYFDDTLIPILEESGFSVEPGHHYEWIWLLDTYAAASRSAGRPAQAGLTQAIQALATFADRFGIDAKTGLVKDVLWSDGRAASDQFRLWPQTERLKREIRREPHESAQQIAGFLALARHFEGAAPGLWHERLDADGRPVPQAAPATSLYHICCGLADASAVQSLTAAA